MEKNIQRILRYFFSGTLFIVPLVATGYFIVVTITWLDSLLNIPYPGVGVALIFFVITGLGFLTSNYAFITFTRWFDHGMNKIPLVKLIYSSLKDLMEAFVGNKKKFNQPVLVLLNKENQLYQMGFITQADLSNLGLNDLVSVYLPHSYAFSGNHYLVPKDHIKPINLTATSAMKYIVSGGISGFDEVKKN